MTLDRAKEIAANPGAFSHTEWLNAYIKLSSPKVRARISNCSDRVCERYFRRLANLDDYLIAVGLRVDSDGNIVVRPQ